MTQPHIDANTAAHVLFHYGHGGYQAGGCIESLITTIDRADDTNRDKLALGFPEYVAAVTAIKYDPDGVTHLVRILDGEAAVAEQPEPQCPEALFNPDTGDLRRCVVPPGAHEWHQTDSGLRWNVPVDTTTEVPF